MGELNLFLGIQIVRSSKSIFLSQQKYIVELLYRAGMDGSKGLGTPMVSRNHLSNMMDSLLWILIFIGALQYTTVTRHDIAFSVNKLNQYMQTPLDSHWKVVK